MRNFFSCIVYNSFYLLGLVSFFCQCLGCQYLDVSLTRTESYLFIIACFVISITAKMLAQKDS